MRAKPGQLKFSWSHKENDIVFSWGGFGADITDAGLLNLFLTSKLRDIDITLQEELIKRGYDITTIKFSINKKEKNDARHP